MNVLGLPVSILEASDPTMLGRRGTVVLETAKTLVLQEDGRKVVLQKRGTVLGLPNASRVGCDRMTGRLEDRLRDVR